MNRFIDCYKEDMATKYDAGIVHTYRDGYIIASEMIGAKETFSVGQPVYDGNGKLMGYMGIGLYANLDYSTEGKVRIPVEHWMICLPTKFCVPGKKVYTYWQNKERQGGK